MTPKEIKRKHESIPQEAATALAKYLDAWMKDWNQTDKKLVEMLEVMKKDKMEPYRQARHTIGAVYDWFAYGN